MNFLTPSTAAFKARTGLAGLVTVAVSLVAALPALAFDHQDYNVLNYGADPTGAADSTSSIQAAINAAAAVDGGTVFVPPGLYTISSSLTVVGNNIVIRGIGAGSEIVSNQSTGALITIGNTTVSDANVRFNEVHDLWLDRSVAPNSNYTQNPSYGVNVLQADFTKLSGLLIRNSADGISLGIPGATGLPMQNVHIDNCMLVDGQYGYPEAGITIHTGADFWITDTMVTPSNIGVLITDNANGVWMTNVELLSGGTFNYGVYVNGNGSNCQAQGCNFAIYYIGGNLEGALQANIYVGPQANLVFVEDTWIGNGNGCQSNTMTGLLIAGAQVTVSGCSISNQAQSAVTLNGAEAVKLIGNHFKSNSCGPSAPQPLPAVPTINVIGGTRHVIIDGNQNFESQNSYGIYADNTTSYVAVTSNDFSTSMANSGTEYLLNSTNVIQQNNF